MERLVPRGCHQESRRGRWLRLREGSPVPHRTSGVPRQGGRPLQGLRPNAGRRPQARALRTRAGAPPRSSPGPGSSLRKGRRTPRAGPDDAPTRLRGHVTAVRYWRRGRGRQIHRSRPHEQPDETAHAPFRIPPSGGPNGDGPRGTCIAGHPHPAPRNRASHRRLHRGKTRRRPVHAHDHQTTRLPCPHAIAPCSRLTPEAPAVLGCSDSTRSHVAGPATPPPWPQRCCGRTQAPRPELRPRPAAATMRAWLPLVPWTVLTRSEPWTIGVGGQEAG